MLMIYYSCIEKASSSIRNGIITIALVVMLAHAPSTSKAGPAVHWFGNDARSAAMGGSGIALGSGLSNLLINPAAMSFAPAGVWMGFSAAPGWMKIDPEDRDSAYNVPDSIYEANPVVWGEDRPLPSSLLDEDGSSDYETGTSYLLNIGVIGSFDVEGLRVGIGFTTSLPSLVSFNTWYNDEREQYFSGRLHFERFGEFDEVMTFYPGVSYSPLDWLSLGFSLKIDMNMGLGSSLFLPEGSEWEYSYINPDGDVAPAFRPIAGVAFRTPIDLFIGLVYRHFSCTEIDLDVDIKVWNGEREDEETGELKKVFHQDHTLVLGYVPREVALGLGYVYGPFSVEASAAWEQWSEYRDHHGNNFNHPTTDPDDNIEKEGWDSDWKDPEFSDIFSFRAGAEWWIVDFASVRAGTGYFPSPMPEQTGRYNYVDNDLVLYSIGTGFRFELFETTFTVDVAAQLWQMLSLEVSKLGPDALSKEEGGLIDEVPDTAVDYNGDSLEGARGFQSNNPGFPGYSFGGLLLNTALTLGMEFN